jgi:signal transduction histidine kinase
LQTASVLILTDDSEFARLLTSCWRTERRSPAITVLDLQVWQAQHPGVYDLTVIGPIAEENLSAILSRLSSSAATILCNASSSHEIQQLRSRYPRLVHIPLREDWAQTLLLVAGESLRRVEASHVARQALSQAARSEGDAVLGRYMLEMKHSINNALTSILGNAELLLLEPGQLSAQSLQQIKTVHHMSLRLNEIMQRFSSLASDIRDAETPSQPETEEAPPAIPVRR